MPIYRRPTIAPYALMHLLERCSTILDTEGFPGEACRQERRCFEEGATNDKVAGAMQLEEEGLSKTQGSELNGSTRLPEIDLIQVRLATEKSEPVAVGNANEGPHWWTASLT